MEDGTALWHLDSGGVAYRIGALYALHVDRGRWGGEMGKVVSISKIVLACSQL